MKNKMFVVCHMLASLDGKIDGDFFSTLETMPALHAYGKLREFYHCPAILYGTTTMLGGYADGSAPPLNPVENPPAFTDWINPKGKAMGNFIVSVDLKGQLGFSSHQIAKKGRPSAHVIEVLTRQVSPAYLAYLQELGISYLFAGKDRLGCSLLLEKLQESFGIDRLMVAGGGVVNWSFLREGLIDELSLVLAPVADGGTESVSIFEQADFLPSHPPVAFALKEVKPLGENVLWLRYTAGQS